MNINGTLDLSNGFHVELTTIDSSKKQEIKVSKSGEIKLTTKNSWIKVVCIIWFWKNQPS